MQSILKDSNVMHALDNFLMRAYVALERLNSSKADRTTTHKVSELVIKVL